MTKRRPHGNARRTKPAPPRDLRRDDFPALTSFFGGYLHEDFPEVHGSVGAAAAAFGAEASLDERRQLARELETLVKRSAGWPMRDLRRFITRDLMCRWEPGSRDELTQLLDVLRTGL